MADRATDNEIRKMVPFDHKESIETAMKYLQSQKETASADNMKKIEKIKERLYKFVMKERDSRQMYVDTYVAWMQQVFQDIIADKDNRAAPTRKLARDQTPRTVDQTPRIVVEPQPLPAPKDDDVFLSLSKKERA